jgi:hypothetical protein
VQPPARFNGVAEDHSMKPPHRRNLIKELPGFSYLFGGPVSLFGPDSWLGEYKCFHNRQKSTSMILLILIKQCGCWKKLRYFWNLINAN